MKGAINTGPTVKEGHDDDLLVAPAPGDDAGDEGGGTQVQLQPLVL